jgi:FixJ family two-component response regulator
MHRCQSVIYVVDDDASVRKSLALLLMANGFKAETFSCATEFMACKHPRLPSCLLLDVRLPDISGPILQETMAAEHLDIPIIFITGHGSIPMGVKAMKKGAVDFLTKPFSEKDLLDAVERALARSRNQNETSVEKEKISSRIKTLSPRELEVFHFVARGMLNKQIASRRGTALQTIKVHRSRVMRKMHAKTITELISFARQAGIVSS